VRKIDDAAFAGWTAHPDQWPHYYRRRRFDRPHQTPSGTDIRRRKIGFVFQRFNLFPTLTGRTAICVWLSAFTEMDQVMPKDAAKF
jgi:ABC-type lipoprotein export system ATPase subunit